MKFIVSSTALSSHLQAISRVINSKNALPILDCFLFELQDGTLSATVSDSETTMVTTVEVNESDMDGRFAVTAKASLFSHPLYQTTTISAASAKLGKRTITFHPRQSPAKSKYPFLFSNKPLHSNKLPAAKRNMSDNYIIW